MFENTQKVKKNAFLIGQDKCANFRGNPLFQSYVQHKHKQFTYLCQLNACRRNLLVIWCFKPSQRQRIISGLRVTYIKRYKVTMTNKAELRPEELSEKAELSVEFMEGNTVEWAIETETDTETEQKSGQARLVYV